MGILRKRSRLAVVFPVSMVWGATVLGVAGISHAASALELGQCFATSAAYQQALTDGKQFNLVVTNGFVHDPESYESGHFEGRLYTGGADGRGYIATTNYPIGNVPPEGSIPMPPVAERKICLVAETEHLALLDARLKIIEEATNVAADAKAVEEQCAAESKRSKYALCSDHNAAISAAASMGFYTFIQGIITKDIRPNGMKPGNGFSLTAAYKGDPNGELGQITPQGARMLFELCYNTDYMPNGLAILDDARHRRTADREDAERRGH